MEERSMNAVVFHSVGNIRLEDVPEPMIEQPTDAIIEVAASAICGTDLHFVRGTVPGMKPGMILGHEAVGIDKGLGRCLRIALDSCKSGYGLTAGDP
jgi:threonine dehydrogenase-like Zn-dependent dehydrogenase